MSLNSMNVNEFHANILSTDALFILSCLFWEEYKIPLPRNQTPHIQILIGKIQHPHRLLEIAGPFLLKVEMEHFA